MPLWLAQNLEIDNFLLMMIKIQCNLEFVWNAKL